MHATKIDSDRSHRRFRAVLITLLAGLLLAAVLVGCESSSDESAPENAPPIVDVMAVDYAFQAPDSIPSGWTTFRMVNEGSEHHHFHLYRLPKGKTAEDFRDAWVAPIDSLLGLLKAGTIDSTEVRRAMAQSVPAWARRTRRARRGGVGAVAPGRTGQATIKIHPGHYVMNCVIPTPEGAPHFTLGMVRGLTVTDDSTRASAPSADVTLRATGQTLGVEGDLRAGPNTIRFVVDEVPGGVRESTYTAWMARLDTDTELDALAQAILGGTMPRSVPFVGGFEYLPVGRTAYFTVDLSSGRYGLVWGYANNNPKTKEVIVE